MADGVGVEDEEDENIAQPSCDRLPPMSHSARVQHHMAALHTLHTAVAASRQCLDQCAAAIVLVTPIQSDGRSDERPIAVHAKLGLRRTRIVLDEPRVAHPE